VTRALIENIKTEKHIPKQHSLSRTTKNLFSSLVLVLTLIVIWVIGEKIWDERYYVAEDGIGYWMGIIGGTLMVFALFYAYVKRKLSSNNARFIKYWFNLHIFAGIVGPVIILFHTTFQLGSVNGTVAFFSTVAVFLSGLTGRYILTGLHSATNPNQLASLKRLMSVWRHIHVPLLYILVLSGVIHVIAVHLY